MALNENQLYTVLPQVQVDAGFFSSYDRGGQVLGEPGIVHAQYPANSPEIGMVTAYMTPISQY